MSPDQMFVLRPLAGWARYHSREGALWIDHPGGGVWAPRHNAKRESKDR
jgi:hypothetical protein